MSATHQVLFRGARPGAFPRPRVSSMPATLALVAMVTLAVIIVAGAASGPSFLVPSSRAGLPDWLGGPLAGLGPPLTPTTFSVLVLVMCACYAVVLASADLVSPRAAVWAIGALHLIFVVGPPILTTDVFGYLDYGRLGALHDLNPYVHGANSAPDDPIHPWVVWHDLPSPYGPLFTAPSYALAQLDFRVGVWVVKAFAAAASLGCVALVWRCAERRGGRPVNAALLLGLNPLLLVWAVGGAHNDLLVALLLLVGIERTLAGGEAQGGAAVLGAAAVKVTGGIALPFLLLAARRRVAVLGGALLAGAAILVLGLLVMGGGLLEFGGALAAQQELVSAHSIPTYLGELIGAGGATAGVRLAAGLAFAAVLAVLLIRTWRGADWLAAAGWATLALLLTTAWLMPWYIVWLLPLAALGRSSRLVAATLALSAFIVTTRLPILFG